LIDGLDFTLRCKVEEQVGDWVGFRNNASDRMLEQARTEFDLEKRKEIYWHWQELIHEEQPYTFVLYHQGLMAYHKRFEHVDSSLLSNDRAIPPLIG
jgi:ABC-type transport system substrate-binding protein